MSQCLIEAIENNLNGFWAGTTDDERREMGRLRSILMRDLSIPEPDRKRRVYRKFQIYDNYAYLDELEPSPEELLECEGF